MQSYAFVGESAAAAEEPPDLPARVRRRLGAGAKVLGVVAVVGGGSFLGALSTPFHYVDALVVIAVALVPAMAVAATFLVHDRGVPVGLVAGGPLKAIRSFVGILLAAIVLPGNLLLYANERLDPSPAVIETAPVAETWIRHGRHGGRTYMAGVASNVASPLGRWSFYGAQPIAVARNDWTTITPGRTRFVLREHRGLFRLPWFEPNPARAW